MMQRRVGPICIRGWGICISLIFFFQAEDGIRDDLGTGVQTCALPISVTRSAMRRGSGAGGAVPPSATTADSVAASPPSDEAGMIDPSIEVECYSRHRAGASDFIAAACLAVLVAILRDGRAREIGRAHV